MKAAFFIQKYSKFVILTYIIILIVPESIFAWGALTHIHLSSQIISASLPSALLASSTLLALLKKYSRAFYYGSIAPDLIIAKKLVPFEYHTHNWNTAKKIFREASSDEEKAFAYGFLSHLAADTVAHNYFSPYKLMVENTGKNIGHAYWEIRADSIVEKKVQHIVKEFDVKSHSRLDDFLAGTLEQYPFSINLNKRVFIQVLKIGHGISQLFNFPLIKSLSRYALPGEEIDFLFYSSVRNIADVLNNPENSDVLKMNPAGIGIDVEINKIHNTIKKMIKQGVLKGRADYERAFELLYKQNFLAQSVLENNKKSNE